MNPIVIPTWKRVHKQQTWNALAPELRPFVHFVVRPEEAQVMTELYPAATVIPLPASATDMMKTRQWIWDTYSQAYDVFYELDDDIHYFSAQILLAEHPELAHLAQAPKKNGKQQIWLAPTLRTAREQFEMFAELDRELATGVGMTSPRPNNSFPSPDSRVYPRASAKPVTACYAFNAALLRGLNLRFDRLGNSISDMDFLYQVLARGIDCTYCTNYKYNVDTMAVHSEVHADEVESHKAFIDAWPGYASHKKLSARENADHRSFVGLFGERTEGRGSIRFNRAKLLADQPWA